MVGHSLSNRRTFPGADSAGRVVVIGGGTAGWMSAATLRRRLGCDVTLVESSSAPGVGVGEATIPAMLDWIANMGIDEDEFVRRCGGSHKLAIRFDNWVTEKHSYWHPFGTCGATIEGADLIHFWRQGISEGWLDEQTNYTDFNIQTQLCQASKSFRTPAGQPIIDNYAFHLDAGLLADFIREIAIADGAEHRIGHVCDATITTENEIASVQLSDGSIVQADLFIDCTGFAAALIEKKIGAAWIDCSDQLLCDRAVTIRVANDQREPVPYTISTGMDAGWSWQIPLRDALGAGYVFSSKHIDDDSARQELCHLIGQDPDSDLVSRVIPMRVGYRPKSWIGNCVAIGLASGFVEPLESTGIFLVQRALDELVDCLPINSNDQPRRDTFNTRMETGFEEIRDFVLLHYIVSERRDTQFWRDATSVHLHPAMQSSLESYQSRGQVDLPDHDPVFAKANHHFIMNGASRFPTVCTAASGRIDNQHRTQAISHLLNFIRTRNDELTQQLSSHHDLLDSIHLPTRQVTCQS